LFNYTKVQKKGQASKCKKIENNQNKNNWLSVKNAFYKLS